MTARRIGIHLFEDVEELDAVGPWEVLASWTRRFPDDGWEVCTFASRPEPVRCAKGMRIVPDRLTAELPDLDVLLHPGGRAPARCCVIQPTSSGCGSGGPRRR